MRRESRSGGPGRASTDAVVTSDHTADLLVLLDGGLALQHEADPEDLARLAADTAARVLHAAATALLLGDTAAALSLAAGSPDAARLARAPAPTAPLVAGCLRSGTTRAVPATTAPADAPAPHSLVAGLRAGRRHVGVILVTRPPEAAAFDDHDVLLGGRLAVQAALSLDRLRALDDLARAASRDELTGVGNRRHASRLLGSLRPGDAVVLVDVDNLKDVNDTLGHAAGDALLSGLGCHLGHHVRDDDAVARLGGDEFLVVLRGIGNNASAVAERLVREWRSARLGSTLSMGVAVHRKGALAADTLAQADSALLSAKESGRDRVRLDPRRSFARSGTGRPAGAG